MKRIMMILLALLLTLSAAALAEVSDTAPLAPDTPIVSDLDGDGTDETWVWNYVEDDFEQHLCLTVTGAESGESATYDTWIMYGERLIAQDLDGDGTVELLASGDVMSDDYYTWCLNYQNGEIYDRVFADAERGANTMGYFTAGYGQIESLQDGRLTLSGSQDMFGTWFASRVFRLMPNGRFEFEDDGRWVRTADPDDVSLWAYAALTAKAAIPCEIDGAPATLNAGERCLITGTNKQTEASFVTEDGRKGSFAIEPNWQTGWGFMVDGVPEEELFETLPYAD